MQRVHICVNSLLSKAILRSLHINSSLTAESVGLLNVHLVAKIKVESVITMYNIPIRTN